MLGLSGFGFVWGDRGLARFFAASATARLAFGMLPLSTVLCVKDMTGSYASAGVALAAFGVASALAPVKGHMVDRVGRRALAALILAFAASVGAWAAIGAFTRAPVALIGLAGLAGALLPPIGPATRTVWGAVFAGDDRRRQALFALDSTVEELAFVVGPLLVGAVTAVASPAAALAVLAGTMLLSGLAMMASPLTSRLLAPPAGLPADQPARVLPSALARRLTIGAQGALAAALGALELAVPALARREGVEAGAGLLLAGLAAGSVVGGLWYGVRAWRGSLEVRFAVIVAAFAAALAPLAPAGSLAGAGVLLVLAGLALGPTFVILYTLVDGLSPPGASTRTFALLVTVNNGGVAGGSALAGALAAASGPSAAFVAASVAAVIGAALAAILAGLSGHRTGGTGLTRTRPADE